MTAPLVTIFCLISFMFLIVGGVVGGVAGFFAGEAIGKYLGGTIGARMVGDPLPSTPTPKEFTEDDQNKLKEALKDEKIREKLSPGHLGILNKLANVNLKSGGLAHLVILIILQ